MELIRQNQTQETSPTQRAQKTGTPTEKPCRPFEKGTILDIYI
jgi:hypothetical protein